MIQECSPYCRITHADRGYTLLEIAVVMFLMSLMAAVVTVSLSGSLTTTKMDDVTDGIAHLDRQARDRARDEGHRQYLLIDANQNELVWQSRDNGKKKIIERYPILYPHKIESAWHHHTPGNASDESQIDILINRDGQSNSYGVTISGAGGKKRFLLFAGLTGQMIESEDETTIDAAKNVLN